MNLSNQIVFENKKLEKIIENTLSIVKLHFYEAEILIYKSIGINVSTRFGKTENIEFNNDKIIFITVYFKNKRGSASSTDLSANAIKKTLAAAIDIARFSSQDLFSGLADAKTLAYKAKDLKLFYPADIDISQAINFASESEIFALNLDNKIKNTEGGGFNVNYGIKVFGNTHGMLQSYYFSKYLMSSCVIAQEKENMERDYAYTVSRNLDNLKTPMWVGQEAASKALMRLSPKKIGTMKTSVVFSAEIAESLFLHLADAINGNNIYQKSSFLLNSLKKQIFPSWLTIEEKPHTIAGLYSCPFDNEGVITKKRYIIYNGILMTWLLDTYSSRKIGLSNTGHAGGIYNWHVTTYKKTKFQDLLKELDNGLLITELMGQGVNKVTGNYSRGAAGFWIEKGKIKYPVSEITISGNLHNMWKNILNISNDIDIRNNIQCGSLLMKDINISGK